MNENMENYEGSDIPTNTKATVKRLLHCLGQQKKELLLIAFAALLGSAAFTAMPLMIGVGIDNLLGVIQTIDGRKELLPLLTNALAKPVILLILASILNSALSYVQQYMVASVGENLTCSLREEISRKISRLPLCYFDSHKTGDIMSRVTNDLEKVSSVMQVSLMQFISSSFTIVLTCLAMLILNPVLFLLILVFLVISTVATGFVSSLSQRFYAQNMEAMGTLSSKVEEYYAGNRMIKILNQQEDITDIILALNQKQFEANRKAQFADFAIYPCIRFVYQLGFVAAAIAGGVMAINGRISLGSVQAFLQYVNQISEPVTQASYVITSLQGAIAGAERVFALLDEEEERTESDIVANSIHEGSVLFQNVKFGYTADRTLIKDLSLTVRPNEMVAIVGPTGGGKTTLINLLMRFYELNGGSIEIDGIDITHLKRNELRRKIGMVLQDTWLFKGTIAENIAYGRRDASREDIIAAAKASCCDHFIRTLPEGYNTIISSESINISQGQMQLLTIARAMLTNPSIMILDEATSSVDTRTETQIQKAMTRLMKNKTSFVIAHRLSTIKNADMILVVKDGDIIERGNHETLLQQNGFYASLYNSQFETA